MPLPSYFRSRSHSYLRAIQAGCSSQEEDSVSLQSLSPPPSTGSLSNSRTLPSEYHVPEVVFCSLCTVHEGNTGGQPSEVQGRSPRVTTD